MSARRTVEQIKRDSLRGWKGTEIAVLSPDEAQVWLATSDYAECLTHIVRYATAAAGRPRLTFHVQCGAMVQHGHAVAIADETFACGRCIAAAEKHGEPTFGMIPTSGCEVSNGKRRGRPAGATHLSRRGYEAVQP